MGRKLKTFIAVCAGTAAAWALAVKPRIWNKPDISEIQRFDFAHRGFHDPEKKIPENSLAAFRAAIEHGYGISLDVRITRDGVPVVFADSRLDRLTGTNGTVENSILDELKTLYLDGTDEQIPTLAEALELIDAQVPVLVNLMTADGNHEILSDLTCEVLDAYEGVFAVESLDFRVLRWFKKQRNEYIRGQKADYSYRSGYRFLDVILDFLTASLLLNFLTCPDYVSANIDYRRTPSLFICRLLYRVPIMDGLVTTLEDYELVRTDGSIVVFEEIEP